MKATNYTNETLPVTGIKNQSTAISMKGTITSYIDESRNV